MARALSPARSSCHARHCSTSSSVARAARAHLQGLSRRRWHGQVAAAVWLHLQGASPGGACRRHVQDDVHQFRQRQRPQLRRRIPRAGAEREAALHGQVRRSESSRRHGSHRDAEESVGGHGSERSCRPVFRTRFRSRPVTSAGRNRCCSSPAWSSRRSRASKLRCNSPPSRRWRRAAP